MIAALRKWLANEWRLLALDSWADGAYEGPEPCTAADPRCQRTMERLAEVSARMKRTKARMLDGRAFTGSAATDVRATILRAMAVRTQPVREVRKVRA